MYNPQHLIVKNIGPIKTLSYNFLSKVVLLIGDNQTDEGQDSNGSGKSYIPESIAYATAGTSFRKVTDEELIREGEKSGGMILTLFNPTFNRTLIIDRCIFVGSKSSTLKITLKDPKVPESKWEKTEITSVNEGNKFILDELGLSREDILNYFMISKEKYTSFFSSSDTAKKELISRFSKANLVDEYIPEIEKDIQKEQIKLKAKEKELTGLQSRLQTLQEDDDEEAKQEKERMKKEAIDSQHKLMANAKQKKLEDKKLIKENEVALKEYESKLKKIPGVEEIKEKIHKKDISYRGIKASLQEIKNTRKETQELLSEIERNLAGVVECPECGFHFNVADHDFDVAEGEETKKELEEMVEEFNQKVSEGELTLEEMQTVLEELNDEVNKNKRLKSDVELKINTVKSNISLANQRIKQSEDRVVQLEKSIEELKKIDAFGKDAENERKIKETRLAIKKVEDEMLPILDKMNFYDVWVLQFTSFKTFLANKSLDNITNYTNLFLEKLDSSIRVKFEGYKELKSKKIKEKITVRIFKFGEDKGSYGKLSGGEKARVEIAIILAMGMLINSASHSGGLNLVIIDEILESLDETGLKNTMKSMNGLDQYVMMITHGKVEDKSNINIIEALKINNITNLKIY